MKKFYRNLLRLETRIHDMKGSQGDTAGIEWCLKPLARLIAIQIHFEGKIENRPINPGEQITWTS
jgi:hypothetical protein